MLPELSIKHEAACLVLRFKGDWTLKNGPPSNAAQWETHPWGHGLRLDFQELGAWDSVLLAFIGGIKQRLQQNDKQYISYRAPAGLEALLHLAQPQKNPVAPKGLQKKEFLTRFGNFCLLFFNEVYAFSDFVGQVILAFIRLITGKAHTRWSDTALMIQHCGIAALPVVSLIGMLTGIILSFVGIVQLRQFGAELYVADLVGLSMVREMGALMVGIILAGRTGASFAAQIGNMKVSEETDALQTLGVSPIEFLVLPRVIALFVMIPLLCIYADIIGIIGSIIVSMSMMEMNVLQYLNELEVAVSMTDISTGLIKSLAFGTVVALVGCLRGLQCKKSAEGVGLATTSAVVTAIVLIVFCDTLFAFAFNLLGI